MKSYQLGIVVLLLSSLLLGEQSLPSSGTLIVTVTNIKDNKGNISIGIYNNKNSFPNDKLVLKGDYVKSQGGAISDTFSLSQGSYAIAVYQDKNENKKLDKSIVGAPQEPYGFSNNIYKSFGRPYYEKSLIKINTNDTTSISITLR